MKIMADMDAVHLGLDENEADIAEELQHFDDSFDTRSEASESDSSSDSQPSISSMGSENSNESKTKRKTKTKKLDKSSKSTPDQKAAKRSVSPAKDTAVNGKSPSKKRKDSGSKSAEQSKDFIGPIKPDSIESASKKSRKKSIDAGPNTSTNSANVSGSVKSDASDDECTNKPKASAYDSDSESENSDSAANIKRNGRKTSSKNSTPEKRTSSSRSGAKGVSSYDYKTKLNYLFRDTRFFLIKSNNADNVTLSKTKNVWATLPQNDSNLTQAFKESRNVLLIFSVNESGKFAGFARMSAPSNREIPQPDWVLPSSISAKALGGVIEIDWICRKELSFNCTSHLYNSWNEGKPVKIGRDGQEIEPKVGAELCRLFPEDEKVELTPILRKSKATAKMMREKGIRMVYKAPKSLSSRGGGGGRINHFRSGGGGDRNRDGGGPMRHKRFGSSHRTYKMPYHPGGGGYKRGGSPYRGGPGGGAGGNGQTRAGGGDAGLPPWDRYITPTAAAEAYLVDYMRTMHGQLPPLPFVPPFGQMPPPTPGGTAVPPPGLPASMYEFPPPSRYYDGPPLPDYPPPQPARPPPPGYDKSGPSFEDFAAWKHAGLPTGSLPPGFPPSAPGVTSTAAAGTTSTTTSSTAGGPPNTTYRINRNNDMNNANVNRARDRPGRGNDYHHRGGGNVGGSSRAPGGGADRDRGNIRSGGVSERSSGRYSRGSRR
ncbi:YTH domain-containing protein 1 [Musca domestica]|uniref:Uncharacterized protein LOC101897901 n=1 Tax=Musca domestica TaxID=7370 RepID=A0A1I8M4Z3_MUSDO|nr:YTH domain-containing protein 1 [Musca domestica]XP_019890779.1 YTH domain-containing protein 1 [Musca domestica]